ncbi:MAG: hypothetical protein ABIQ18_26560 [Umezawaea sp.]
MADPALPSPTTPTLSGTAPLLLSTSPRTTWVWAPDTDTAHRVRAIVRYWKPAYRKGVELTLVTDVDIGVDALEACEALAAAGYVFGWHDTEHPFNRYGGWRATLPGMSAGGEDLDPMSDPAVLREALEWMKSHGRG